MLRLSRSTVAPLPSITARKRTRPVASRVTSVTVPAGASPADR